MVSFTERKTACLFLLLPLVCVGFILFTIGYLFVSSFTSRGTFVGFQNFVTLFTSDPYFWPALWHNIFWMVWAVIVPIGIGLVFAILLSRNIRGEKIFKGVIYFPALLAGATIGVIWSWFYLPETYGVLNSILGKLGLMGLANPTTKLWINDPSPPVPFLWMVTIPILVISIGLIILAFRPKISRFSFIGVCVVLGVIFPLALHFTGMVSTSLISILLASSWAGSAISMVMFLAGMQTISRSQLEAAKIDCASEAQTLRHVVLPSLKPVFVILIILSAISSMKAFDVVYTLAGQEGGAGQAADVLALYTYRELKVGDYGYASTIGFVGILVTMIPVLIYLLWIRKREVEE